MLTRIDISEEGRKGVYIPTQIISRWQHPEVTHAVHVLLSCTPEQLGLSPDSTSHILQLGLSPDSTSHILQLGLSLALPPTSYSSACPLTLPPISYSSACPLTLPPIYSSLGLSPDSTSHILQLGCPLTLPPISYSSACPLTLPPTSYSSACPLTLPPTSYSSACPLTLPPTSYSSACPLTLPPTSYSSACPLTLPPTSYSSACPLTLPPTSYSSACPLTLLHILRSLVPDSTSTSYSSACPLTLPPTSYSSVCPLTLPPTSYSSACPLTLPPTSYSSACPLTLPPISYSSACPLTLPPTSYTTNTALNTFQATVNHRFVIIPRRLESYTFPSSRRCVGVPAGLSHLSSFSNPVYDEYWRWKLGRVLTQDYGVVSVQKRRTGFEEISSADLYSASNSSAGKLMTNNEDCTASFNDLTSRDAVDWSAASVGCGRFWVRIPVLARPEEVLKIGEESEVCVCGWGRRGGRRRRVLSTRSSFRTLANCPPSAGVARRDVAARVSTRGSSRRRPLWRTRDVRASFWSASATRPALLPPLLGADPATSDTLLTMGFFWTGRLLAWASFGMGVFWNRRLVEWASFWDGRLFWTGCPWRLERSPPNKAYRVRVPGFRTWESCWTIPLAGGFSRGYPVSPPSHSGADRYSQSSGSQYCSNRPSPNILLLAVHGQMSTFHSSAKDLLVCTLCILPPHGFTHFGRTCTFAQMTSDVSRHQVILWENIDELCPSNGAAKFARWCTVVRRSDPGTRSRLAQLKSFPSAARGRNDAGEIENICHEFPGHQPAMEFCHVVTALRRSSGQVSVSRESSNPRKVRIFTNESRRVCHDKSIGTRVLPSLSGLYLWDYHCKNVMIIALVSLSETRDAGNSLDRTVKCCGRVAPDFRMCESCGTMPLVGGFSRGYPVSPVPSFWRCCILISITLIGSQDLDVKSRPNLFTHSVYVVDNSCVRANLVRCTSCRLPEQQPAAENAGRQGGRDAAANPLAVRMPMRADCVRTVCVRGRGTCIKVRLQSVVPADCKCPNINVTTCLSSTLTVFEYRRGLFRISACGNRVVRCMWSAGFLGDLHIPPLLHSGTAPYLPRFTLIGSQDLDVTSRSKISTLGAYEKDSPLIAQEDISNTSAQTAEHPPPRTVWAGPLAACKGCPHERSSAPFAANWESASCEHSRVRRTRTELPSASSSEGLFFRLRRRVIGCDTRHATPRHATSRICVTHGGNSLSFLGYWVESRPTTLRWGFPVVSAVLRSPPPHYRSRKLF
ncbi:hypothetical protein PR048_024284, partial [Dryococelus australis]